MVMHFNLNGTNSMSCVTPARAQICRGKSHARTPADGVLPGEVMKVQFPMPMRLDWEKILHEGTTDCGGAARPMPAAEQSNAHRTVLMDFRTSTRFTSSTASNGEQHAMLPIHQIEF